VTLWEQRTRRLVEELSRAASLRGGRRPGAGWSSGACGEHESVIVLGLQGVRDDEEVLGGNAHAVWEDA
jgi:hypothetical protein